MAPITANLDAVRDVARFVIRDRDRARRIAAEYPELPQVAAKHAGMADAHGATLAYLAGYVGLRTVDALELLVQGEATPKLTPEPSWTESEQRAVYGDR